MAKGTEGRLSEAVGAAGGLAQEFAAGAAVQLVVDLQENGEYPYRVIVPDEPLPLIGLAVVQDPPAVRRSDTTSVTNDGGGSE